MSNYESTRVMGTPNSERTLSTPAAGSTLQMPAGELDPLRTQMGATSVCPVCNTQTPVPEIYCGECGFLLSSTPEEDAPITVDETPTAALVDVQDGRRFTLKTGLNTVGRQGTDVIAPESTVSRIHARVTLENGRILVEDLGSSNGTKVGDRRIAANEPTAATNGAALRFGSWRVTLDLPGLEADGEAADEATQVLVASADRFTDASLNETGAVLKKQSGPGDDIPFQEGTVTLGRRQENTVALPQDAFLSGRHAELSMDATGCYLVDVGSTNGTVVNGRKLIPNERQLLLEGDEVQIGQSHYLFTFVAPLVGGIEAAERIADSAEAVAPDPSQTPESMTSNPEKQEDAQ